MIYARRINETTGEVTLKGSFEEIMDEYKQITNELLLSHFDEFMAVTDKWNEEIKGLND